MAELIEKRGMERIPVSERTTGFWPLFLLWSGFLVSVGRMWQGGIITSAGFWPAVTGYVIAQGLMIYVAIGAIMGASEGLPGTMLMRAAFGVRGRIIPSVPIIIATTGWFGLQLGMTASALDIILRQLFESWNVSMNVLYILLAFFMGVISVYGYRVVMVFQKFVVPLLIVLVPWMLYRMIVQFDVMFELSRTRETNMNIYEAITIISGGGLALMIAAADSSRYAKGPATAFAGFMAANWTVGILVPIVGMMGAVIVGVWDPAGMVDKLGLGLIGVLIIILSAWSTNCMNPYWGGIALSTLTTGTKWAPQGIPRTISTTIIVVLGAVTSLMGIYSIGGLLAFVAVLAGTLGPANGILIADYFFIRGRGGNRLEIDEMNKVNGSYWYRGGWNPVAIIAWAAGVTFSFAVRSTYILIPPVSTMVLSGLLYFALMKMFSPYAAKDHSTLDAAPFPGGGAGGV